VEKIEKQILRLREKWRDTKRTPEAKAKLSADVPPPAPKTAAKPKTKAKSAKPDGNAKQVFKVNHKSQRKPMTVEEAMLEIDDQSGYMVYRDADSDRVHVLVKRSDGHFDLIES
jgi:putative sigma-54 modulation protein